MRTNLGVKCNSRILATVLAVLTCGVAFCGEIHDAAKAGDVERVRALLKANPELVNAKDIEGKTPLYWAERLRRASNAKLLRDAGGTLSSFEEAEVAIAAGDLKQVKELVSREPWLVKVKRGDNGGFLLHKAAGCTFEDIVKFLLESGADVSDKREDGMTPLHSAIYAYEWTGSAGMWKPNPVIIDLLLEKGADVNAKDKTGLTPLMHATRYRDDPGVVPLVQTLLRKKADVDVTDDEGCTALHHAGDSDAIGVIILLLEAGADVNVKDLKGQTPLKRVLSATIPPHLLNWSTQESVEKAKREWQAKRDETARILRQHGGKE